MDEQWKECMLGDGTKGRNRWKAAWGSSEDRKEGRLRGEGKKQEQLAKREA